MTPDATTNLHEAVQARRRAEEELAKTRERGAEIRQEVAKSRQYRRVNHFAELIIDTFQGGR